MTSDVHKCQEPTDMQHVKSNPTIYQVFKNARWHFFFARLCGYNDAVTLEFAMAFSSANNSTKVRRLSLPVTPQVIVEVIGLLET